MYYFISFLAPFFYACSVVIESFLSLAIFKRPIVMLFYVSLTNALFTPIVLLFQTPSIPSLSMVPFYLVLSIIDIAYLYPYYIAFKKTDTSIISALFALGKIFVPVLSFFMLKDILTLPQYLGFAVIILSSVLLNINSRVKVKLNSAFYWMFLSSFLLALRICLVKFILKTDENVANVLIYPNIISGFIPFAFLLWRKNRRPICQNFKVYRQKFKLFALIEWVSFLAVATSTIALTHLSPVICTAIEATEPLFVWLIIALIAPFSSFRFSEKKNPFKKVFCFLSIILGIILTCY